MCERNDRIELDSVQKVLANIRMADRVTRSDLEIIFMEMGGSTDTISKENLMRMI